MSFISFNSSRRSFISSICSWPNRSWEPPVFLGSWTCQNPLFSGGKAGKYEKRKTSTWFIARFCKFPPVPSWSVHGCSIGGYGLGCFPRSKSEWQVKVLSIFWFLVNSRLLENNSLFPGMLASWGQKRPWPSIAVGILARNKGFKKRLQQKPQIHPKIFWFYLRGEPEDWDMFLGFNVCPLAFHLNPPSATTTKKARTNYTQMQQSVPFVKHSKRLWKVRIKKLKDQDRIEELKSGSNTKKK